ncbi:MAG: hypothetical protein P1P88_23450, partial [Bacteroidales bacterium]|nr:hypothetical protein [Bacteroidales bacterium]
TLNYENNSFFFIKTKSGLQPVGNFMENIPTIPEFVASINKRFKLKTEQDGIDFQTALYVFDQKNFNKGFFQKGNIWYFIREKFFDDISGYQVVTDNNGTITSIIYNRKMEVELPEELIAEGKKASFPKPTPSVIEKSDSLFMRDYAFKQLKYRFSVEEISTPELKKVSGAGFYNVQIFYTQGDESNQYESTINTCLLAVNGAFGKDSRWAELIQNELFTKSIQKSFMLKSEKEARQFEILLDTLWPILDPATPKNFYKKDDIWFFVREVSGDETTAMMVLTDKIGKVLYTKYGTVDENNIMRLRMKDENFKIDYAFNLMKPQNNNLTVKAGTNIPVEISFNVLPAQAKGAWVLTRFDGKKTGFYASTSIESPYTDEIPAKYLTEGAHTVEYLLLPSGPDTDKPLGKIILNITVN